MGQLTKPSVIKSYMQRYNFFFKKDLGQNYLIDDMTAEKIVDSLDLDGSETVLEIGPGIGALTELLVQCANKVKAVEIDPFTIKMLSDIFAGQANLTLVQKDILKADVHEILEEELQAGVKIKAVSNLPYYITSAVIMKLLEDKAPFERIVVMMQKEVAARLGSPLKTKDYSVFTVALDYYAEAHTLFDVSRNVFMPSPNVDSAVVRIIPRDKPKVNPKSEKLFFKTLKAGFAMRRKTMLNCISAGFSLPKDKVQALLSAVGIEENARAETLTIEQFAALADVIDDAV